MEQVLPSCRCVGDLTENERRMRSRQVEAHFRPGVVRRVRRSFLNVLDTIRDAFAQSMNAVIGQMARVGGKSSVAAAQKGEMERVGKSLLGAVGNAYEPMLDRLTADPDERQETWHETLTEEGLHRCGSGHFRIAR